ncbi:hypothetical protein [Paenibacillus sp. R14(2021)]|uniref:hypothetical protein n=1 Tax=Paenibacillus sp. R14(2021) TaxID=2859228 RepID=UPI001C611731|nr:hypothetical protein [Paenibacillus sp. R14(2021)]
MEPWQTIMIIGGIAVVCAAVLPRRAASNAKQDGTNQSVRNMETALEQFMENMEADNREIANLVSKSNQESQALAAKRDERLLQLEKRCAELEQKLADQSLKPMHVPVQLPEKATLTYEVPPTIASNLSPSAVLEQESAAAQEQTPSIQERYAELFDMYRSGKSIDVIAKKLGRNKGEIQLILQLSKQEEAARHE